MIRHHLYALGLATLLAVPAHAQSRAASAVGVPVMVASRPADAARMDVAAALANKGHFRKAAAAYHAAAEEQLRHGELPELAYWQEASMYFAIRDNARAAVALDALARHAGEYGNPPVQVRAMLYAAVLHAQAGNARRASELADDLHTLRNSPYLDAELRSELDARLGPGRG